MNEPTTFEYKSTYGGTVNVALSIDEYVHGGMAIAMWTKEYNEWVDDEVWELYADVTRWLYPLEDNLAFVDENNMPGIGKWLEDNGLATPMGIEIPSGFCIYPLYQFTPKFFESAIDQREE